MDDAELCFLTATEMAGLIRAGELSARDVMGSHLQHINRVDPKVNAIVTLLPERAMESAREADERQARGEALGALHGLPIAHKDLISTKGIRTHETRLSNPEIYPMDMFSCLKFSWHQTCLAQVSEDFV